MISNFAVAIAALPLVAHAVPLRATRRTTPVRRLAWTLAQDYQGQDFLNGWSYFTDGDPTGGQVTFVQDSALQYYDSGANATILKTDASTDLDAGAPRRSSRIQSNAVVNQNSIVIGDFNHVPYGCSVWPAFWLVGPQWPANGEVDIFEGVNQNTDNAMTLHTTAGCNHDANPKGETGAAGQVECDHDVNSNTGCGVTDTSGHSYGPSFNDNGGGVWATLWDSDGFSIWFWPRSAVPADVNSNSPAPEGWGTPSGFWSFTTGACTTDFFHDLQAVFDITLCGQWAGQDVVYQQTCSGTCSDAVRTGSNFNDAFFSINKVQFYSGA